MSYALESREASLLTLAAGAFGTYRSNAFVSQFSHVFKVAWTRPQISFYFVFSYTLHTELKSLSFPMMIFCHHPMFVLRRWSSSAKVFKVASLQGCNSCWILPDFALEWISLISQSRILCASENQCGTCVKCELKLWGWERNNSLIKAERPWFVFCAEILFSFNNH